MFSKTLYIFEHVQAPSKEPDYTVNQASSYRDGITHPCMLASLAHSTGSVSSDESLMDD